jgi:hypothetical protein
MSSRTRDYARFAFLGALLFVLGAVLPYVASYLIADSRRTITELGTHIRLYWQEQLIAFGIIGIAYLLYLLRKKYLAWYGALEIMVAYLGAFHSSTKSLDLILTANLTTLDTDTERMLALLALVASVYVGVAGLENLIKGLKGKPVREVS